jgi:hypothetical protein
MTDKPADRVEKSGLNVPAGSIIIMPDDAITGSAAIMLVLSPWFTVGDKGYFILPSDDAAREALPAIAELLQRDMTEVTNGDQ